jgi:hypothetical protein
MALLAFLKKWGGHIAIIAGLVLITLLFFLMMPPLGGGASPWIKTLQGLVKAGVVALIGLGFIALAICFPLLFRADVSTKDDHKNERRMRRIILYSYSVAALSLGGSILPFIFIPSSFPGLYKLMLTSSVGIVLGCSDPENAQGEAKAATPVEKPPAKPEQNKPINPETPDRGQNQQSTKKAEDLPAEIDCSRGSEQWVLNIGGMILSPRDSKEATFPKELPDERAPWWPRARIHGGLVVPLYFLVLSLIGGAISLTRRVPEYHRRYSIHYVPTEDKPRLDRATVREYLAFQIIQFISAPLLAMVAYYVIAPEKRYSLILLGFAAGFSSEAILLMIRSLVEKLSPASKTAPQTGSASGNVSQGTPATPVVGATVTVVGKPTLTAQTDQKGYFIINGIPAGDQVIEATYQAKKGTIKITIEAGKTTVCHIDIA